MKIVNATVQHSYLWEHVEVLSLQQNMRLQQDGQDAWDFIQWLLDIGHGCNHINESKVQFLEYMQAESANSLIASIYPAIDMTLPPPE